MTSESFFNFQIRVGVDLVDKLGDMVVVVVKQMMTELMGTRVSHKLLMNLAAPGAKRAMVQADMVVVFRSPVGVKNGLTR